MGRGILRTAARWPTSWRPVGHFGIVAAFVVSVIGYPLIEKSDANSGRPQQAGQPVNGYAIAAHVALARADAIVGDARGAQAHVNAIAHDLTRSMRVPDVNRPIDHEAARAAVRPLPGVRSAIWLDQTNFVVMVNGAEQRSMDMIDRVCLTLEPLGDTLAVVVNLQDVTAKDPDAAMTLSRNCQLPEGQRAFLQAKRQVDAVGVSLNAQQR